MSKEPNAWKIAVLVAAAGFACAVAFEIASGHSLPAAASMVGERLGNLIAIVLVIAAIAAAIMAAVVSVMIAASYLSTRRRS